VWVDEFITKMEYAYAAADIVVARSGAMTVAELCVVKKPVLFVPYPFAAEDHQTVNAKQLVDQGAAGMIPDREAAEKLVPALITLAGDERRQKEMRENIARMAITDADEVIAGEILNQI
jgi:UDP-N-acetylglucosamine--N-acetylmuramyl-(pentapeptide) pyrophosphoryl-undecaprenol N-acetylglucosamine transferase